jgi:hypothetical protein
LSTGEWTCLTNIIFKRPVWAILEEAIETIRTDNGIIETNHVLRSELTKSIDFAVAANLMSMARNDLHGEICVIFPGKDKTDMAGNPGTNLPDEIITLGFENCQQSNIIERGCRH